MSAQPPAPAGVFGSLRAFVAAISEHIERAVSVRVPVLKAVMELSEREVYAVGELVQRIRRESTLQVDDIERIRQEIGDEDGGASDNGRRTLAASLLALTGAQQFSASLSRTLDERMTEHERLARVAASSAKRIVEVALEVSRIGSTAALVSLLARTEAEAGAGEASPGHAKFLANELHALTSGVEKSAQQITRLGLELIRAIPQIAEHAAAMQQSHTAATQLFDQRLTAVRVAQQDALRTTEAAVREGRERADRIVRQLQELSARLQFQDSIAQDLTAILNQELQSTAFVQRALGQLPDTPPERSQFELEARRAEHLSHALSAEERARQADSAEAEREQLGEGEDVFF